MFKDKKKIILLSLSILVVIIIVIVVISLLFSNKKITFEELESRMKTAAQVYYDTNKKFLPTMDGDVVEVTLNKLIKEEYLDPIEDLVGKEVKCQGEVVVKNVDGKYSYIPFLDCGKDYTTIELYNKLLEDNPTVTENKGLYVINNDYVFRGEVENNYIRINGYLWRIIGIDSNSNVKLIYADEPTSSVYDDRYNSERESNYGKNDYKISRLYESLNEFMSNEEIITPDFKALLSKINACIGGRDINNEDNTMAGECATTLPDQYATFITLSEYINASLDTACKTPSNYECQNYNYLSTFENIGSWWSITPDINTSYNAYQISSYGTMKLSSCFNLADVRPIVYLSTDTIYRGGTGTIEDPYVIFSEDKNVE